jgi:hypothetical protein
MPSNSKFIREIVILREARNSLIFLCLAAVLLAALATTPHAAAQDKFHFGAPVIALTYAPEEAKAAGVSCGCFWLQGGAADVAFPLYKGLSVAATFTGADKSNVTPGVNLTRIAYLAGPRYAFGNSHSTQLFGEALFGAAHAFNGVFPAPGAPTSTANSFAAQIGGGLDIGLTKGFALRALQIDYVRTALPNNGANTQNDLRLAVGLSYRFSRD